MVLVILAILAAILVPALLGWIDEAKKKQYVLEARNVYIAAQAIADEVYAKGKYETLAVADLQDADGSFGRIETMADLTNVNITSVGLAGAANSDGTVDENDHDAFTIIGMSISFQSNKDGAGTVYAVLDGDTWEVSEEALTYTPTTGAPASHT